LYAICFGFFLVLIDTTALNVAIAAMEREFGGAISGLQWVVNSYTMMFASLLLVFGAVGDRFGARRLYQIGLGIFTGMSLICAISPNVGFLICMRALQGVGAAIMLPASLSLLSHSFPNPKDRSRAVTFWASIVSLGFASGPALGGILTNFFGWRSIFWLNVPVGILALLMVRRFVTESRVSKPRHIDWAGQIFISLALLCLTYALIEAGQFGWTSPRILVSFGLSLLLTMLFVLIERFSSVPVLPPTLFLKPVFSVCVAIGMILNFGMYGILFVVSIYLQNTRHLNALWAGLMIVPLTGMPTVAARFVDRYYNQTTMKSRLIAGHVAAVIGGGLLILALFDSGFGAILLGLGVLGIGMGVIMPAMTSGVLTSAPTEISGLASGILNSSRQMGGTLGVALMGTFVQQHQAGGLLFSFILASSCFLFMIIVTTWFIRPPKSN